LYVGYKKTDDNKGFGNHGQIHQ